MAQPRQKGQTMKNKAKIVELEVTDELIQDFGINPKDVRVLKHGSKFVKCLMVETSEEIYKAYMQPKWREDKRRYRRSQEDIVSSNKIPISIDVEDEDGNKLEIASKFNLEKEVCLKEFFGEYLKFLGGVDDNDMKIIILHYEEGVSQREIAKIVKLSQKTVSNKLKKYGDLLRENMKDFRDLID